MKSITLALAATLLLSACQAIVPAAPQASSVEYRLYDGSADGFTLEYPSTWTLKSKGADGNLVHLSGTYDGKTSFLITVNRVRQDVAELPDLNIGCEAGVETLKAAGYTPQNQGIITMGNVKACEVWGTNPSSSRKMHNYMTATLFLVQAIYSINTEYDARIQAELARVIQSFKRVP